MKKGVFCLSFDTELLWGRHDTSSFSQFIVRADREREVIRRLLRLLREYNLSATWAVVGHLFLSSCKRTRSGFHSEIARPLYPWYEDDWFAKDPGTNVRRDPNWYAPDIVALIQLSPKQEIASHSFSHVIFGHPGCTSQCADDEISQCVALAKRRKIVLRSFVYPRNKVGHLSSLKKYGFTSYRGENMRYQIPFFGSKLRTGEYFSPFPPKVYRPVKENGIVNIPESLYFFSARGVRRYMPNVLRLKKIKQGIDEAILKNSVFHLWTHPTDFTDETETLFSVFEQAIGYAKSRQKAGDLSILTMGQIADLVT